jgi:inosine/xanthosine triphosphate pyrophosphatase family protein
MSRWAEIQDILTRAGIDMIDFTELNDEERVQIQKHLCTFIGRYYAKEDAVANIAGLNVAEQPGFLLQTLQKYADGYVDEQADEAGMARSFYHETQMQLARLEGATGLDLTSPEGFTDAYNAYWDTTLLVIQEVRSQKVGAGEGTEGAG